MTDDLILLDSSYMDTHAKGKRLRAGHDSPGRHSAKVASSAPTGALETWVDEHAQYLFRYALPRVRDHHVAEELVQETFLAALKAYESYRSKSSPRTWLVGILRHKIADYFRKVDRKRETEALDVSDPAIDSLFNRKGRWINTPMRIDVDPAALQERADFWEVFEGCLGGLPELQAEAFSLRVMDDVKSEEVCKVLSISPTNLWVLLHRARARLRVCLEANWFGLNSREKP